jgi:hypothetical protein
MRNRAWRRYIEEKIVIKRLNSLVVKSKYYWYFKDCNMITFKNCKSLTLSDTIGTEYAFKYKTHITTKWDSVRKMKFSLNRSKETYWRLKSKNTREGCKKEFRRILKEYGI